MLPFEEVVEALGRTGQHDLGLQVVPLDAIVGSVDRAVDFDRGLRPTSARLRSRWERIAAAQRRGESLPPVSLYKIGDLYFVRDGHHRVSVAKSLGRDDIDAYVVEVTTRIPLGDDTLRVRPAAQGPRAAVPRARAARRAEARDADRASSDPWDFGVARRGRRGVGLPRDAAPRHVHGPRARSRTTGSRRSTCRSSSCCASGDLIADGETETEAYLRVAADRYRALRTHEWSDEVLDELRRLERRRKWRRRPPPQTRRLRERFPGTGGDRMSRLISFVFGAAAGAAATHFLDPTSGSRRVSASTARTRPRAHGAVANATPPPPTSTTSGSPTRSRPRSSASRAQGRRVDVQAGVAYLRGTDRRGVDRPAGDDRHVDGIKGVNNLLHEPGKPAPGRAAGRHQRTDLVARPGMAVAGPWRQHEQ